MGRIDEFLAESAAVCAKATEGYFASPLAEIVGKFHVRDCLTDQLIADCTTREDRDFIAFARTAIPKYERLVRELMAAVEERDAFLGRLAALGAPDHRFAHLWRRAPLLGLSAVESRWSGEKGGEG